jgi:DUF1365 family protein
LDSTFIRGCEDSERHLEVRIGNVETATGSRQEFGAVAKTDTDLEALIRRSVDTVGRTKETVLTALTDRIGLHPRNTKRSACPDAPARAGQAPRAGPFLIQATRALGSAFGWEGRVFCHDKSKAWRILFRLVAW